VLLVLIIIGELGIIYGALYYFGDVLFPVKNVDFLEIIFTRSL
jgi:hypothetical protein